MNFRYTTLNEMAELCKKGREAIVLFDINVSDIDEYINNCIITLDSSGVNTNNILIPKVKTNKDKKKTVFLVFRDKSKIETHALNKWARNMGNVTNLKSFFDNNYNSMGNNTKFLKNFDKFKYVLLVGKSLEDNKNFSTIMSLDLIDRCVERTKNTDKYIAGIVKFMFEKKIFLTQLTFRYGYSDTDGEMRVTVEPTIDSVKVKYEV